MRFGVITPITVKITLSCDVTPYSLVHTYNPGDGGGACLLNVGTPIYQTTRWNILAVL